MNLLTRIEYQYRINIWKIVKKKKITFLTTDD